MDNYIQIVDDLISSLNRVTKNRIKHSPKASLDAKFPLLVQYIKDYYLNAQPVFCIEKDNKAPISILESVWENLQKSDDSTIAKNTPIQAAAKRAVERLKTKAGNPPFFRREEQKK